jgi:hypothetical protein
MESGLLSLRERMASEASQVRAPSSTSSDHGRDRRRRRRERQEFGALTPALSLWEREPEGSTT